MGRADRAGEMFAAIGAAPSDASGFGGAAPASMLLHAAALSAVLVAPLWTRRPAPEPDRDHVGILLYDPPPAPAPPLPLDRGTVRGARPRPEPVPERVTPVEPATPDPVVTTVMPDAVTMTGGSPRGSEGGVVEGEEYGRDGGIVGGLPGGIAGGVPLGTGSLPVPVADYQHGPRRVRMVEPVYPPEAFAKKIQGTVQVEILIDVDGRVVRTRVTRSIPQLDAAAVEAVRQWRFIPAMRDGRPVPALGLAPVQFTIY